MITMLFSVTVTQIILETPVMLVSFTIIIIFWVFPSPNKEITYKLLLESTSFEIKRNTRSSLMITFSSTLL